MFSFETILYPDALVDKLDRRTGRVFSAPQPGSR